MIKITRIWSLYQESLVFILASRNVAEVVRIPVIDLIRDKM